MGSARLAAGRLAGALAILLGFVGSQGLEVDLHRLPDGRHHLAACAHLAPPTCPGIGAARNETSRLLALAPGARDGDDGCPPCHQLLPRPETPAPALPPRAAPPATLTGLPVSPPRPAPRLPYELRGPPLA